AARVCYGRLGFDCWLHGGERCFAKDGAHREHAVFGNDQCASAHPSDIAAALVALGATLTPPRRAPPAQPCTRPSEAFRLQIFTGYRPRRTATSRHLRRTS